MAWPLSPTNGQQTTIGGIVYQYVVATQTWDRMYATVTVPSYSTAVTVSQQSQPNITSIGTLASTTMIANANITMSGILSQVSGANLVSASYLTGTLTTKDQPNITSIGTLVGLGSIGTVNFTSASNVSLGPVSGVHITGGTSGQYLQTDGSGTLSWSTINSTAITNGTSNVSIGTSGGNITMGVAGTSNVIVVGSANTTVTGNITSTANISSINANLGNLVIANYYTGTLTTAAQPNITSVGTLVNTTMGSANSLSGGNLVSATYLTGTLTTQAQPNITSVGTLVNTTMGSTNSLSGGNLVSATYLTGTLTTQAQPNITSVGTLVNTTMGASNSLSGGNLVSATYLTGTLTTQAQPNITSVGTLSSLTINGSLTVTGSVEIANVSTFKVKDPIIEQGGNTDGTALTSNDGYDRGQLLHYYSGGVVDAFMGWDNSNAEFAFGSNVAVASEIVTFNTFGNVRANWHVGTGVNVTGNVSSGNATLGNLVTSTYYTGTLTTGAQPNITSVGTLINTTMASTNSLSGGNLVSATYLTGTLTTQAQPNITSVGTLVSTTMAPNASFTMSGILSQITGGNLVSANYVTGTISTTSAAQPNITSVGTLTNLNVSTFSTFGLSSDRTTYVAASGGGTVNLDVSTAGPVWYYGSISSAFTANLQNVPSTTGYTTVVALVFLNSTYVPSVIVNGSVQTIKWINGSAPTGSAAATNVYTFTLMNVNSSWITFGQQALYV